MAVCRDARGNGGAGDDFLGGAGTVRLADPRGAVAVVVAVVGADIQGNECWGRFFVCDRCRLSGCVHGAPVFLAVHGESPDGVIGAVREVVVRGHGIGDAEAVGIGTVRRGRAIRSREGLPLTAARSTDHEADVGQRGVRRIPRGIRPDLVAGCHGKVSLHCDRAIEAQGDIPRRTAAGDGRRNAAVHDRT